MLDNLSHGRLDFGAGFGIQAHEFIRWKLPFGERRAMGEEVMDIVLKAWTQDEVTYDGHYWSFDEALPKPKPYQQPYPPVWVGAHSERSFDYAACHNFHVGQNIDVDRVAAEEVRLLPAGVATRRSFRSSAAHALGTPRPCCANG